jgi:hypothetical protein
MAWAPAQGALPHVYEFVVSESILNRSRPEVELLTKKNVEKVV